MADELKRDLSTIEALLPNPSHFLILYHGLQISISGFSKINIQFANRIFVRDGVPQSTDCPMITYYMMIDDRAKGLLYNAFLSRSRDTRNHGCIVRERSSILLGEGRYQFHAFLNFIPNSLARNRASISANSLKEDIYVEMDFNRVKSSIYTSRMDDFYKEYDEAYSNRFELLDIG
jgi:hypothetical protein